MPLQPVSLHRLPCLVGDTLYAFEHDGRQLSPFHVLAVRWNPDRGRFDLRVRSARTKREYESQSFSLFETKRRFFCRELKSAEVA